MDRLTIAAGPLAALTSSSLHENGTPLADPKDALAVVHPLYEALTAAAPNDVRSRLEAATSADWQNCSDNQICETREATISRWSARIERVPDFRFDIREVLVSGNRIIVRSEAAGTPAGPFMGTDPQGRSFRIMTLDMHEIYDRKVIRTYHVEDWARASRQLRGEPM
jgi:predicted ester cyclase